MIAGAIEGADERILDLDEIRAIPKIEFSTFDPWDRTDRTYGGASLLTILEQVGASPHASQVEVISENGYRVTISFDDLRRYAHILSYEMDGRPYGLHAPPEDKGPLAIAIDFEATGAVPELYKHHLAWWVVRLVVS